MCNNNIKPELSVLNFKKLFFQNLKPYGLADLTASTASNDYPHKRL